MVNSIPLSFHRESAPQVIFQGNGCVRMVILNRPRKLNSLNYEMVSQMVEKIRDYENDDTVKLIILKANGKAFCAGGDVTSNIVSMIAGHWSYGASFYRKQLTLDYLLATCKKPLVSIINGIVMGGGSGISMNSPYRIVTENTVFAMPEAAIGLFPDVGASYFLSKLPGHLGEYIGLTGTRLNGSAMLACGLATQFVPSKDLEYLEKALVTSANTQGAPQLLDVILSYSQTPPIQPAAHDLIARVKVINKCFSGGTVEDILASLQKESECVAEQGGWINEAIARLKSASPTSLKIFLRSVREGRGQSLEQCLSREYIVFCNIIRRTLTNDYYEGSRSMLFDKDKRPEWEPAGLEQVKEDVVDAFFKASFDGEVASFRLPWRPSIHSTRPKDSHLLSAL
ncbi:hypothetical protein MLD38_005628 [Melastoma candidum]|uniref:Uncharacterized protein n=1 Tax=Melastoma candidum TaxID=119954 RepID=A0ACB9RTN9_9MYRT|nr:hypothetical protein MLD38_005628 [Melastoma candidum]